MELPKNITQIGETNPHCKIYVEDYVISYIRQLNQYAGEKELAVALYGTKKEEGEITYLFLYGACKLNFLQRECRHLSQAVTQEAEKQRKKYFPDYVFLGYRLLDGEMVEGFHICEQGVCRYVEGYAQFYEKNDCMLALMLDDRQGEAKPEEVPQEKYDMVKKRQEERRALLGEKQGHALHSGIRKPKASSQLRSGKLAAAAVFVLLCGAGLAAMGGTEGLSKIRTDMKDLVEGMSKKQLPDAVEVSGGAQVGTIVAEDKLADAIRKENTATSAGSQESPQPSGTDGTLPGTEQPSGTDGNAQTPEGAEANGQPAPDPGQSAAPQTPDSGTEAGASQTPDSGTEAGASQTPDSGAESAPPQTQPPEQPTPTPAPEPTPEPTQAAAPVTEMVAYIVQRGDTLIGICIRQYGSDARVAEICALNNISNPDDIKEGEKIFLPQ